MDFKVLITTSGLGERLGELTQTTNKSLVPIGDQPAIARILSSYPEGTNFVITLGHKGSFVREFVQMAFPELKVEFVDVSPYSGEGSSLGLSMFQAREKLQSPFIFHAGDTLAAYDEHVSPDSNWLAGVRGQDSTLYASVNTSGTQVISVNPKRSQNFDFLYPGIMGVYDFREFWQAMENVLKKSREESINDLSAVEGMLSAGHVFELREISDWSDIGSISGLRAAQDKFDNRVPTLPKIGESIFLVNNKVIKFFSDQDACSKRVERARLLKDFVPSLIDSTANWYSYEFVEGEVAGHHLIKGEIGEILRWADSQLWQFSVVTEGSQDVFKEFYVSKTIDRLNSFFSRNNFVETSELINGFASPTATELVSRLSSESLRDLVGPLTKFHGDFVLDNIIRTKEGFTAIDWRQDFGGSIVAGDPYYDLAKLSHSLVVSHDVLLNEQYELSIDSEGVWVDLLRKRSLVEAEEELAQFCLERGYSMRKINLIRSLIWLNMAALHPHPMDTFLYYLGRMSLASEMT